MSSRFCPTCQRRYVEGHGFCPRDGTALQSDEAEPDAPLTGIDASAATQPPSAERKSLQIVPGQTIAGRFQVIALLGKGGMGVVYRAHQLSVDREVALKVLHPELARDAQLVRRFEIEAKAASRVSHPNGVVVYDFGHDTSGLCWLAMELAHGRDLHAVLKSGGPLGTRRAVHVVDQVLAYLEELHGAGILHRDLKPENIFLLEGKGDRAKVIDFGLAKIAEASAAERVTRAGAVFGTPHYMAPEQGAGEPVDARADLYSCGIILFELLTGQPPFTGQSTVQVLRRHMTQAVPHPRKVNGRADVSDALWGVLQTALAKSPDERPADAAAMRALLHPFLAMAAAPAAAIAPAAAGGAARAPTPVPRGGGSDPELQLIAPAVAAAFLADAEKLLTARVGPMGGFVLTEVMQAMALTPENLPRGAVVELIARLVAEVPAEPVHSELRAALSERARAVEPDPSRPPGAPFAPVEAVLAGAPLARRLAALEKLLAEAIGPMAAVLLEDALADVGGSRDAVASARLLDLVGQLAENVPASRRPAFLSKAAELAKEP
jgi:predicted Ser/Thr protein kinase